MKRQKVTGSIAALTTARAGYKKHGDGRSSGDWLAEAL